jgi:hypothetical protein
MAAEHGGEPDVRPEGRAYSRQGKQGKKKDTHEKKNLNRRVGTGDLSQSAIQPGELFKVAKQPAPLQTRLSLIEFIPSQTMPGVCPNPSHKETWVWLLGDKTQRAMPG